jgi:hypothetical protein|tara:strand:- start:10383 stop:10994 length:612 start_codon:yes stop_codon:yes gene_type:complete
MDSKNVFLRMKLEQDITQLNRYTYAEYRDMINTLLAEDKTTGDNHSEAMLGHTTMNVARMNRLDKRATINEDLADKIKSLPAQTWLVISEAWCGDAAQNLPWINKMAELNEGIELTIVLRDENSELIDQFLTNGGRSIPKVIALSPNNLIHHTWGPRPQYMQEKYTQLKEEGLDYADISKTIHTMYAKNKGEALHHEYLELLG